MIGTLKLRLEHGVYIELPAALLERINELIVRVYTPGVTASRRKSVMDHRVNNEQSYSLGYDSDGLLSVRGIAGSDRWTPALVKDGLWIRRTFGDDGEATLREVSVDSLLDMAV